ncbi:MAG TPA: signal peptide peptidase SppA [bacterium]|jgi:protease-4
MKNIKKSIFIPIAIIAVFGILSITLISSCGAPSGSGTNLFSDRVGLLYVEGIIASGSSADNPFISTGVTSDGIVELIEQAIDDNHVKAIVVRVNSPGGSAAASDEIYHALKKFSDTGRPVVVSMADVAASGGYYISAAADKIYANPSTLTGSIGVIMQFMNYEGLFDMIGLSDNTLTAGEFKDIGSPTRPMTDDERGLLEDMLREVHGQFKQAVMDGRGIPEDEIDDIANGMIYTGTQAKDNGLVDEIGGLQDAIADAANMANLGDNPVVDKLGDVGFLQELLKQMGAVQRPASPIETISQALNPASNANNPLYAMWNVILLDPRLYGEGAGLKY